MLDGNPCHFSDSTFLFGASGLLYSAAFVYTLVGIIRDKRSGQWPFYVLMCVGFILQSFALYGRGLERNSLPVNTVMEWVQVMAWSFVLVVLILRPLVHVRLLSFFGVGLASFLSLVSLNVPAWDKPIEFSLAFADNPWVRVHASVALFSYGLFGLMAMAAVMYLIQDYGLSRKYYRGLFRALPSLGRLESTCQYLLYSGFVLLTLAVLMGSATWVHAPEQTAISKLVTALALWLCFVSVFTLRQLQFIFGRTFAYFCCILFSLALFSLWPLNSKASSSISESQNYELGQ